MSSFPLYMNHFTGNFAPPSVFICLILFCRCTFSNMFIILLVNWNARLVDIIITDIHFGAYWHIAYFLDYYMPGIEVDILIVVIVCRECWWSIVDRYRFSILFYSKSDVVALISRPWMNQPFDAWHCCAGIWLFSQRNWTQMRHWSRSITVHSKHNFQRYM